MAWITPPTFVSGATLTAAQLNILATDLAPVGAARVSYTPTWTQTTTNPTLGNGNLVGEFRQVNHEIDFDIKLTIGSTTVLGTGVFQFALPVAAARTGYVFLGGAYDSSAGSFAYPIAGEIAPGVPAVLAMRCWSAAAPGVFQSLNQTQPFTWATDDTVTVSGRYEAV